MCVIMSKPQGVAFPEESILKNCWDNNPDMGGFMFALNGHVYIQKGYSTWEGFKSALTRVRAKFGDDIPYVCHFRISTQGYDTSCCQPFPLSSKMKNLKKSRTESNMGVAHNGILSLTSDGSRDYSDTMKFITDYLTLIIRGYDWHEDERTVKLIENLIEGSRFAILDKTGFCKLLGKGWIEDKGCWYSNSTYSYKKWTPRAGFSSSGSYCRGLWDDYWIDDDKRWDDYWTNRKKEPIHSSGVIHTLEPPKENEYEDTWNSNWNPLTRQYDFSSLFCPYSVEDDDSYCVSCSQYHKCPYIQECMKAVNED